MLALKNITLPGFETVPFFCINAGGAITACNEAALSITDTPDGSLDGVDFSGLFVNPVKVTAMLSEVMQQGIVSNYPLEIIKGDRQLSLLIDAFCGMSTNPGERMVLVAAAVNDGRKRSKEKDYQKGVKEVADYKFFLDESSIVSITDQNGIITHVNQNFCNIAKFSPKELIGKDHRIINSGFHAKSFIRNLWVTIANGQIWKGELKNKAKDGTYYWVDTTIVPFLNEEGKPYQYLAIRADISERKKLEAQQQLYASIINSSEDAILSKTLDGIITGWNHGAEKTFGYTAGEVLGKHISLLIPLHLHDEESRIIEMISSGQVVHHYETDRLKKDGNIIHVSLTISPLKDGDGRITGASKIIRDITRQKIAETAATTAYKEKETVLERITDSVISLDDQWRYTYLNKAALATHPLGKAETLGKVIWDVHPGLYGTQFWDKYHEAMDSGKVLEFENYYEPFASWYKAKVYPSADGVTIFYQDVTETKNATEKLLKNERIYKTIASSIPGSIICLLDTDFRYLLIEGDMVEKLGYEKQNMLGSKAVDVLSAATFMQVEPDLRRVLNGEFVTKESSRVGYDLVTRFVPLKDQSGAVYAILTLSIDVSRLKAAQRDIAELNRDLEKRISDRTEELKRSNEELESFSYSVSHDLRAPLRAVSGYANILEEDYEEIFDSEGKRLLGEIQDNAKKMGALIDDLLAFSRLGRKEVERTLVNMNKVAEQAIREVIPTNTYNPQIMVDNLMPAYADYTLLVSVMINLISNAVKYSSKMETPIIRVSSKKEAGEVIYSVSDNGVGFDMQYAHKLFGVFQRLHSADEFQGTGVGLAMVQRIIHKHHGRVWAESAVGKGATFYFCLPDKDTC